MKNQALVACAAFLLTSVNASATEGGSACPALKGNWACQGDLAALNEILGLGAVAEQIRITQRNSSSGARYSIRAVAGGKKITFRATAEGVSVLQRIVDQRKIRTLETAAKCADEELSFTKTERVTEGPAPGLTRASREHLFKRPGVMEVGTPHTAPIGVRTSEKETELRFTRVNGEFMIIETAISDGLNLRARRIDCLLR